MRIKNINISFILLLSVTLLIVTPSAAFNITIYGDTAGFDPALHHDVFTVVYSLPGSPGTALDANVTKYTDPSVDLIFMGGDDTFSKSTASQLEQAVGTGKVFVVTDTDYQNFGASLPATTGNNVKDAKYLQVTDPDTPLSKTIFAGLRENFPNTDPFTSRPRTTARPGAVTLLSFDNNDPALLYWQYGNGYVIEWTVTSNQRFLNTTEADLINSRLMTYLLNIRVPGTIPPTTQTTLTSTVSTPPDTGGLSVYSSPLGASILIDGRYYGTTPANLTAVPAGNHIIRLALSGYYDYEGTVYVLAGQTTHSFGTLQPLNQYTAFPTAVPTSAAPIIIEVPATVAPTPTGGPLENPGVLVAVIGVITATIGAAATIFSHVFKAKKE
jgi:PEGA domain